MPEPARIALFWGEDEFLLRLSAHELLTAHGIRATEIDGAAWRGGETSDLATPSLWGERRALLITGCQGLPEGGARELRAYLEAPSPDAVCVLTLVSRGKGPPPLAKLVQGSSGSLVRQVALKRQDVPKWVLERAKTRGVRMAGPAAATLIGVIGDDPSALDQSIEQLANAFPGLQIGSDQVRAQFQGLGEQRVWDLCDQAFSGRLPQALVVLRSLLEGKEDPLMILGGVASRLRDLLRVRTLPERMQAAEAARAAGLKFDWQVRRYREQARRYSVDDLTVLHAQLVDSDRALKGGVAGDVVLTSLVAALAGEGSAALKVPIRVAR
jgi:DNA polymerase-3 subunit delta